MERLRRLHEEGATDTVTAVQVDMQGRLMGKRLHAAHFLEEAWEEIHSCNYLLATDMEMEPVAGYRSASWDTGYGDYVMKPDISTLRVIPWAAATAMVFCDVLDDATREGVPHSPRAVLKRQIGRLEQKGMREVCATELEFYMFRQSYDQADQAGYRNLETISSYNEDYHIFQTAKEENVMGAVRSGLYRAGVPVLGTKGEADSGQHEVNVRHADALATADDHCLVKHACKEIAWAKGRALTFLAKWSTRHAGSSSHIHLSLRSADGDALFHEPDGTYGMSALMRHFLAGLLKHSRELAFFLAPNVNSYKRFQAGTFAPTKLVWALDNRTAGYRVCGANTSNVRIECRMGGSDLNPYLALAALIAAGHAGIHGELELEAEHRGSAYRDSGAPAIPGSLREAADELDGSTMLREAFGSEVIDHYVHAARHEQAESDRVVSDWEVRRGFERA